MNKNHQMLLIGFGVGLAATYLFLNKGAKSSFSGVNLTRRNRTTRSAGDWVGKPCRCFQAMKYDRDGRPVTGYGSYYGTFIMKNGKLVCDCGDGIGG
jgi:hypothetical protein